MRLTGLVYIAQFKCSNYNLFLIHSFMIVACNRKITDIKKGFRKMSLII